ncbi:formylglycine-generating enzyme family protein [Cereibacter sphaeroides]|uniref:SUMF1/EgtB/PvdO family nonheme iron enzyme n=1 Tax=Cereibacter sphaeroides TaxID=1063 RepID=UPI001F37C582|nr:SUMF1/EgtB/PvdO family nonheme iron enzyme [Cereibacter sphaeroides]MCE6961422.1 formylglycine-generating enzyme family protein [Cereibacter sphaeroides]MCE6970409.1 formylglycine-generating enzyme family protein [Cereibacter sphaeroides]MCE6973897.1 formylglycine-generating enzyme family protein [Cereibacter sphaeroides]
MLRLALPVGILALAAAAGIGLQLPEAPDLPALVTVPGGSHAYRPSGEFRIGTRRVDAPLERREAAAFQIMQYQVTRQDYARCVADGDCPQAEATGEGGAASDADRNGDLPRTGVNWSDATAYAAWLSRRTGGSWRLPTDEEWLRAAAERGFDGALGAEGLDPSERWLASYRAEVERRGEADLVPHPRGHFGTNSLGLADAAGNVWEWTDSCDEKNQLSEDGRILATERFCGVRVAQGKHRAFIVDFVRDARSGGCAAGVPPDFLGFRLVRDAG